MLNLSLCFLFLWMGSDAEKFSNPIAPDSPDPWMQYYKGYYYLIATSPRSTSDKVGIRKARTLSGLHKAEYQTLYTVDGFGLWAPKMYFIQGKWYLFYTACPSDTKTTVNCHHIYVAESASDDPMGPYTFKADLQDPNHVTLELDPSYIMIDGNQYLLGCYFADTPNLFIRPMVNPYTPKGPRRFLSAPTYDWEKHGEPINSAPEALYHDGRIFVVYSASHCSSLDYNMGLMEFTGTDPLDSTHWTKYSKPVFQRNDTNHVYGPGHCGHFKSPDGTEDWIVYHASELESQGCGYERATRAQKFSWGEDGLPVFGSPVALGVAYDSPSTWRLDRL